MSHTKIDEDALFAAGDAIAGTLLARLAPLRFEETKDEEERDAAFRLRYRAVVERKLQKGEEFPDGREHDVFDAAAVQIVAWDGDKPIGTCRLVPPTSGRPLPVEEAFGVRVNGSDRMVEWGRMVIEPEYRGGDRGVLMGLGARGWLAMRGLGFTVAIGATPLRLVELFDSLGFGVTVVGPSRMHWGEERCLIVCEGRQAIPGIERVYLHQHH